MNIRATVTDSTHLKLLSPVDLPPGASVVISIDEDTDRSDFYSVSSSGLSHAYSDSEPGYSASDLLSLNPEFKK